MYVFVNEFFVSYFSDHCRVLLKALTSINPASTYFCIHLIIINEKISVHRSSYMFRSL